MSVKTTKVPAYTRHKASGRAVVRLDGRDHYLGPFGSPESHERYARLIAQWQAGRGRTGPTSDPTRRPPANQLSVNEMLLAYLEFARGYYTKDGKPNQEFESLKYAMRPVKQLYGHAPAAEFGPKDLKTVRQRMINQGLSRTYINNQTNRIKRIFKWAVSEELAPPSVHHGLQTVPGLRYGRSEARETAPVRPVRDSYVEAVLPFVAPPVAAMIRLQRFTGMRSGEVVLMRACDIDMTGDVWLYAPSDHKNKWRGHGKLIPLGPRAQAVVKPFLQLDTMVYLFSPRDAAGWHNSERSASAGNSRLTPVYPSEKRRREQMRVQRANRKRQRPPGERYDTAAYVERRSVLARPVLHLEAPVIAWRPGAEKPHFGKAAYRLKSRWRESAMPTEIVRATTRAAQEFGGYLGGRWPRTSETTHDLNLAAVFLWHRTYRSEDATAWIPEAQLYAEGRGLGHRLPDAVIRMGGIDQRIVEFGGSYGKQKLQAFHAEMNTLPYEIW